jgi:hypothetical protein
MAAKDWDTPDVVSLRFEQPIERNRLLLERPTRQY